MFFDSYFSNAVAIFMTLCLGIVTFFKWKYTYWQRKGVPFVKPIIPYGNMKEMLKVRKHFGEVFQKIYEDTKPKGYQYIGAYFLARPVFVPIDTEIAKCVLLRDSSTFLDRRTYYNERDDPLSAHIFNLRGEKWRNLRQKFTPTFSTGQIKYMFDTIAECGKNLEEYIDQHVDEPLHIREILGCFTTDIIASCAFGIECNTLQTPDSEFRKYGKYVFEQSPRGALKLFTALTLPGDFLRFVGFKILRTDVSNFFRNIVEKIVHYRETNNVRRKDFMDLLLRLRNKGTLAENDDTNIFKQNGGAPALTLNEIAAQCLVFYAAGFETSSITTHYAIFELAQNQEVQEKVREEIHAVLKRHEGKVTYDAIMEMSYLGNVVDETLRKYPPGMILSRLCNKDYEVPGTNVVLTKGTEVIIPVLGFHKDPEFYPNPEVFDPDRFIPENKKLRPSCTYLPFGDGPRNCIGLRFGLMQSKVGLVSLLKNYKYVLHSKTELPLVIDPRVLVMAPKKDIWLTAVKLNN